MDKLILIQDAVKQIADKIEYDRNLVTKVAAATLCGLVVLYAGKIWNSYGFFKKQGIKTPKYTFFLGNFPEVRNNKNYSEVLQKWTKEFGKTYGYFEGHLPILVTSDLKLIEEIYIKQFSNFVARKVPFLDFHDDHPRKQIFNATKTRWKRMRNIMNPTFSTSKLRLLNPLIVQCTDRLLAKLDETHGNEVNISTFYKLFSMDTIWNCGFGVDIDIQNNPNNPYFDKSEAVFKTNADVGIIMRLATYFHEFKSAITTGSFIMNSLSNLCGRDTVPLLWILLRIHEIVDIRRNNSENKKKDYIQLLLDAQAESKVINAKASNENNEIKDFSQIHIDKKMNDNELISNLVFFLLAGYETSSTSLSYASYVLATNKDEQQRLYEAIIGVFSHDSEEEPNLDNVSKIEYLDLFIKEVLRMYPVGNSVITRRCMNPTTIDRIDFPYGLTVAVDVLSVHYDQEIWGSVSVNEFYPPRFSPEIKRSRVAFMGFGIGPRNCIGMKFALLELKVALVKLLRKFEILAGPNTPKVLEFEEGIVRAPKYGINVILKKRYINK